MTQPIGSTEHLAPTLEALMDGYLNGDSASFHALYQRLAPEIRSYARRRVRNPDDVEDVVQTLFTKLHRARHSYRSGMRLMPWVMTIARHSVYDTWRRGSRRLDLVTPEGKLPEVPNHGLYAYVEELEALGHAFAELPPQQREAVELVRIDELTGDEAAERLGTTRTGVKLRVHRAHRNLAKLLAA
jgi:RNA polymerase sigma-70 factor (ECF subfamily)